MTRDQFAKAFEQYQGAARGAILSKFGGDHALADDAVQNAAVYVIGRIGRFKQLTRSYFVQLAVNNARMIRRGETRQQMRVSSEGGHEDLVRLEAAAEQRRRGRIMPYPDSDKQSERSTVHHGYQMPGRQPAL